MGGDNVVSLYIQFGIKVDGNDENIEELWTLRPPKKVKPFWLRKKFIVSTVIIIVQR